MKILMIKRESVCYSVLDYFLGSLKKGLEENDAEVNILDVSDDPLDLPDRDILTDISKQGYDAVLTFNAVGQQNYAINGSNFWDSLNIPFINYIVDHPLQHNKDLSEHGENYYVICIDKNHVDYINNYYPKIRNKAFFVPLGGLENEGFSIDGYSEPDFKKRSIDLLFTGSFLPLRSLEEKINEYPQAVRRLIIRHIEYMLENRMMTLEEGMINVLRDYGIDIEGINLKEYLFATRPTEGYVRAYIREEIVRYLIASGINMHIYGNGWELFDDDLKNTVCHAGIPYNDLADIYMDSKIILDQSSQFLYGMHDRIPSAMFTGAAVLTDRNDYLGSIFTEGLAEGELCMYDVSKPFEVPDVANEMLEDSDRLFNMTLRAYNKAAGELTWNRRACEIIEILNSILESK